MGFEEALNRTPTRQEELEMIKRFENDFKSQPNYKWYMNESPRRLKIEHAENLNNYRYNWWFNFGLGLIFSGPAIIYMDRFWRNSTSGAPYFFRPKFFFVTFDHYLQYRRYKSLSVQVPVWLLSAMAYAFWFTSRARVDDENYEKVKIEKFL